MYLLVADVSLCLMPLDYILGKNYMSETIDILPVLFRTVPATTKERASERASERVSRNTLNVSFCLTVINSILRKKSTGVKMTEYFVGLFQYNITIKNRYFTYSV